MRIPTPSDCIAVVGIAIAIIGMIIGLYFVLFQAVYPWGWLTFAVSFTLWLLSIVYCLSWEWDNFTPS